jgi:hypothetical protein
LNTVSLVPPASTTAAGDGGCSEQLGALQKLLQEVQGIVQYGTLDVSGGLGRLWSEMGAASMAVLVLLLC